MNRSVVTELLLHHFTAQNAVDELKAVIPSGERHEKLIQDYNELQQVIGSEGASYRFAKEMVNLLNQKK
jgi:lipid A disaccharide synthetase